MPGLKLDKGKTRYELLSPYALEQIAQVLTYGAKKYAPRNWEKGIAWGRVFGALMRHMWAWWRGENLDKETGLSHLAHAGCCLMFLLHYTEHRKEFDDRPDMGVGV